MILKRYFLIISAFSFDAYFVNFSKCLLCKVIKRSLIAVMIMFSITSGYILKFVSVQHLEDRMKLLAVVIIFIVLGLCRATLPTSNIRERSHVVKKIVKRAAAGMSSQYYFDLFLNLVTKECTVNGAPKNETDRIKSDYDDLKICLNKHSLFVTEKEVYLSNLEKCAQKLMKETTECLPEDHKFLPSLVLEIAKSMVMLLYDDFDILKRDMGQCALEFRRYEVMQKYHLCVIDSTIENIDKKIPNGKNEFCNAYISASSCLPKTMKEFCTSTKSLEKFAEDYMEAVKRPCESENKIVTEE